MAVRKSSGTATKRDPAKWARAKARAKAKMGGKHSARAMQLAVKYYKESGGTYKGKKKKSSNKLSKWSKQKWRTKWETVRQDRREVSSREGNQKPVIKGVCSNHESKEERDCCRKAVR